MTKQQVRMLSTLGNLTKKLVVNNSRLFASSTIPIKISKIVLGGDIKSTDDKLNPKDRDNYLDFNKKLNFTEYVDSYYFYLIPKFLGKKYFTKFDGEIYCRYGNKNINLPTKGIISAVSYDEGRRIKITYKQDLSAFLYYHEPSLFSATLISLFFPEFFFKPFYNYGTTETLVGTSFFILPYIFSFLNRISSNKKLVTYNSFDIITSTYGDRGLQKFDLSNIRKIIYKQHYDPKKKLIFF